MTDQPVETPVSWLQWIWSFLPSLPMPSMPSRNMQLAFAAVSLVSLWYFGKLPSMAFPETAAPVVTEAPAYVTASDVAPLIVEMSLMRARMNELEARAIALEKPRPQITTGSISKPKKQ